MFGLSEAQKNSFRHYYKNQVVMLSPDRELDFNEVQKYKPAIWLFWVLWSISFLSRKNNQKAICEHFRALSDKAQQDEVTKYVSLVSQGKLNIEKDEDYVWFALVFLDACEKSFDLSS